MRMVTYFDQDNNDDTITDCDQPDGYVDLGDDCDDEDGLRHPNAEQTCAEDLMTIVMERLMKTKLQVVEATPAL